MTRSEFITWRKAVFRAEVIRGSAFFALLGLFSVFVIQLDRYFEARSGPPNSGALQFGILIGVGVLWSLGGFALLRPNTKRQLKCPHCNKHLGYRSKPVALTAGQCRHCGSQVIELEN